MHHVIDLIKLVYFINTYKNLLKININAYILLYNLSAGNSQQLDSQPTLIVKSINPHTNSPTCCVTIWEMTIE